MSRNGLNSSFPLFMFSKREPQTVQPYSLFLAGWFLLSYSINSEEKKHKRGISVGVRGAPIGNEMVGRLDSFGTASSVS